MSQFPEPQMQEIGKPAGELDLERSEIPPIRVGPTDEERAAFEAEDAKARRVFDLLGVEPVPAGAGYRHLTFGLSDGTLYDLLEAIEKHVRLLAVVSGVDLLAVGPDDRLVVRVPEHPDTDPDGDVARGAATEIALALDRAGVDSVVLIGDLELAVSRAL